MGPSVEERMVEELSTDWLVDRRGSKRRQIRGRVRFEIPEWPSGRGRQGTVVDHSATGVCMETDTFVYPGLQLALRGTVEGRALGFTGTIRWAVPSGDRIRCGIELKQKGVVELDRAALSPTRELEQVSAR